ncbi:predicted protein [Naegleria gruberi]|uniref:Predicted protein n=1 Tax=Naegleria gruberi TaxID=5762 RepID=D2VZK3_NAEGR|nr:uncharacterized protein NAEGRDRAFT_74519 [Naegleria gruberi]EFC37716.1 predicted protein [Naegleria gruberi]|eukprot:XP_002670460.1 predicted protein [Naegleria gruberi strain NEG-M]
MIEVELDRLEFEESEEEARKIKETYFGVNMDKFITSFDEKNETMPTRTIPLTVQQGKALLHLCRHFKKGTVMENEQDLMELKQVSDNIEKIMKELNENNYRDGFIVKLTSRSPKDITPNHEKTMKKYRELLETPRFNPNQFTNVDLKRNAHWSALYFASLQCLRVYNAQEAISLLSQSSRIEYDLLLDLTFESDFSLGLVVRPWDANMTLESEFRGIVYNGELKCLSQYFTQCYLESLEKDKEEIEKHCKEFFSTTIKPVLQEHAPELTNYIVDFSLTKNEANQFSVKLLEINPYLTTTGVGLFDWEKDTEPLFENPKSQFEFRILTEPIISQLLKDPDSLVKSWRDIITQLE